MRAVWCQGLVMDGDMRRVVVKEHYRRGDVVRALQESDGLDLDEDTLCALTTHCVAAAAPFAHVVYLWHHTVGICLCIDR